MKKELDGCDICHYKPCNKEGIDRRYCFVRFLIVESKHYKKGDRDKDVYR